MNKMNKMIMIMVGLCFLLLITFFTSVSALPENWPKRLTITSGPMGGPWYPAAVQFSGALMKKFPGLSVTVIEGSGIGNIRLVDKGRDAQIGITISNSFYEALKGSYDDKKYLNIKATFALMTSYNQVVVRADSDIYSFSDLKDKRICPANYRGAMEPIFKSILKQYDLDYDKIHMAGGNIIYRSMAQMPELIKDDHVDFLLVGGNLNNSVIIEIQSRIPLRLLPMEESKMKAVVEECTGLGIAEIPAGIFHGNKEPVDIFTYAGIFIVNKDLPEDFVYEMTKVYMDMSSEVKEISSYLDLWAKGWEAGKTAIVSKEVMHSGALRAFEEAGYGY